MTTTAPGAGVSLRGLRKSYGDLVAVAGVDLDVAPGEVVALLGPNGAGKSTTIDMLLGLTRPDTGSVSLWGMSPARAGRRGIVGAMLQAGGLLANVTVRELVQLMRGLAPDPLPLNEVVAMAHLADVLDSRADRLSGGQTQRVRFALAIAGNPQLLVLDEPTVAMDVSARRSFWAVMHEWTGRGRTVVFATHYLEEADAYADRAVLMARGRIVADGPVTEVKARVGGRTVRATLPGADLGALGRLPGVTEAAAHGDSITLHCNDSDAALRALLPAYPMACDLEVVGLGLEEAFLALTDDVSADDDQTTTDEVAA